MTSSGEAASHRCANIKCGRGEPSSLHRTRPPVAHTPCIRQPLPSRYAHRMCQSINGHCFCACLHIAPHSRQGTRQGELCLQKIYRPRTPAPWCASCKVAFVCAMNAVHGSSDVGALPRHSQGHTHTGLVRYRPMAAIVLGFTSAPLLISNVATSS